MDSFITDRLDELRDICRRREVRRLWLFGSAVTDAFDPSRSDVDALVEFRSANPEDRLDGYLGLSHDLERLFERSVDVVEARAIRNPYFRDSVESTRVLVYETEDVETVPA